MATQFIPDGGTYGTREWTSTVDGTVEASAVDQARKQSTKLVVAHTAHVYFADYARPPVYFVIHHMEVEAAPGSALADRREARGFFNSSVRVSYRGAPGVSAGCTVRRVSVTPGLSNDDFDTLLEGPEIAMDAKISSGSGRMLFKPSYQVRHRMSGWSLRAVSDPPAWELHQREVWNAIDVDGKDGDASNVKVPSRWIEQFFDGTPFGRIADMPKTSFGPVKSELIAMWRIGGTFTPESRAATLSLGIDYTHRVNLFHNATLPPDHEPRRICGVFSKTDETTALNLHEIALAP